MSAYDPDEIDRDDGPDKMHESDEDCAPFLDASDPTVMAECTVCHVIHGDPCPECGGCGFHGVGCARAP